jgi:hypothetical protein
MEIFVDGEVSGGITNLGLCKVSTTVSHTYKYQVVLSNWLLLMSFLWGTANSVTCQVYAKNSHTYNYLRTPWSWIHTPDVFMHAECRHVMYMPWKHASTLNVCVCMHACIQTFTQHCVHSYLGMRALMPSHIYNACMRYVNLVYGGVCSIYIYIKHKIYNLLTKWFHLYALCKLESWWVARP